MKNFGARDTGVLLAGILGGCAGGFVLARGSKSEPPSIEDESITRYRIAVRMAWADEELTEAANDRLGALERELGLGRDHSARIERDIMGASREDIPPPRKPDGPSPSGLDNEAWMKLVEECVEVVDELDRHMTGFDAPRQELADHVMLRIEEVLDRSGVDVISDDEAFDSRRHKPEKPTSQAGPEAAISETLSPGFAVGRRVLRRARVRVE